MSRSQKWLKDMFANFFMEKQQTTLEADSKKWRSDQSLKERLRVERSCQINCQCGWSVAKGYLKKHLRTTKHTFYLIQEQRRN